MNKDNKVSQNVVLINEQGRTLTVTARISPSIGIIMLSPNGKYLKGEYVRGENKGKRIEVYRLRSPDWKLTAPSGKLYRTMLSNRGLAYCPACDGECQDEMGGSVCVYCSGGGVVPNKEANAYEEEANEWK